MQKIKKPKHLAADLKEIVNVVEGKKFVTIKKTLKEGNKTLSFLETK